MDHIEHLEVLYYLSDLLKPRNYLEIGVREGASVLSVLCKEYEITSFVRKTISDQRTILNDRVIQRVREAFTLRSHIHDLYLSDVWVYPEQSKGDHIRKLIHDGFPRNKLNVKIMVGNSKFTVSQLFKENPDLKLDLVLLDGNHSDEAVKADLDNLVGHFKVLVAHDIFSHDHPNMIRIIKDYVKTHSLLTAYCGHRTFGTAIMFDMEVEKWVLKLNGWK